MVDAWFSNTSNFTVTTMGRGKTISLPLILHLVQVLQHEIYNPLSVTYWLVARLVFAKTMDASSIACVLLIWARSTAEVSTGSMVLGEKANGLSYMCISQILSSRESNTDTLI